MEDSKVKLLNKQNKEFCKKISLIIGTEVTYEYKHYGSRYLTSIKRDSLARREVWLRVRGVGGHGKVGLVWIRELIELNAEKFTEMFIENFVKKVADDDKFMNFTIQVKDTLERYIALEKLNKSLAENLPISKASSKITKI